MQKPKTHPTKLWTSLALFCFTISLTTLVLWIRAFNMGSTQQERVGIYLGYFPYLNLVGITLTDTLCCIVAIALCAVSLNQNKAGWRLLNIGIIAACALKMLLTLWGFL